MPLTKSGKSALTAFEKEYGKKKGKSVFYAKMNKDKAWASKMHK